MLKPESYILRIGHRPERDQRVTTHVGLSSRALGASGMYLAADDQKVADSIADVAHRFGGTYFCENNVKWKSCINNFKRNGGKVVHLTMYGLRLQDVISQIRTEEKILVVVGAEKVPGDMQTSRTRRSLHLHCFWIISMRVRSWNCHFLTQSSRFCQPPLVRLP